jgi:thiol-disulfide isomerase/thioredoxin
VNRYPAIFVDDVLVATPNDFGFYGKTGPRTGRYAPLKSVESHERFRADLKRMIDLLLAGRKEEARAAASPAEDTQIAALPAVTFTDLEGKALTRQDLAGRPVLVEIWATWCVPCRPALAWLKDLKQRYGDRLAVVTIAVESDEAEVRKVMQENGAPFHWTMGTPDMIRALGDVSAVPTLLLFDQQGKTVATFYGAPPTLHQEAEAKLAAVVK